MTVPCPQGDSFDMSMSDTYKRQRLSHTVFALDSLEKTRA